MSLNSPPPPQRYLFILQKLRLVEMFFFSGTCFGLHHSLSPFGFQWNYGCSSSMECGQLSSRYFSFHLDNILSKLGLRCAVFPLLFLATALLHRCLSFLKWGLPHLELNRSDDAKHLEIFVSGFWWECKQSSISQRLTCAGAVGQTEEGAQMSSPGLGQWVLSFKCVLNFCGFKQMLKRCFKHLKVL